MIILLDIDGVMVPAKNWERPQLLSDGFPAFSKPAVETLKQFLGAGVELVITSTHKSNYSIQEWLQIFHNRGIRLNKIQLLPDNTLARNRKDELLQWLEVNHYPASFVIIDDDSSLQDLPHPIKSHWVHTSSHIGLTEKHAASIKAILTSEERAAL